MKIDPETKKSLRTVVAFQCLGMLAPQLFANGFILTYLSRLDIPSYRIFFLLALLPFGGLLLTVPFAYLSDRYGKKRVGTCGLAMVVVGLVVILCAGFTTPAARMIATAGILFFSLGTSAAGASWFALLSPIIPQETRGRFFGKMRLAWQSCSIVFTLAVAALLKRFTHIRFYQCVLLLVVLTTLLRIHLYRKIPELEPSRPADGFWAALTSTLRIPNYLPFCSYSFLLTLFTGSVMLTIGMLSKDVLLFTDAQILIEGNCAAAGAIAGFYIGGKMVDHIGTRFVFLICHIGFSIILALFVLRGLFPVPPFICICLLCALFGTVAASSGIAFSSELLAIIPPENKSLSTGFHGSLQSAGVALSSLLIGQSLKLNMLNSNWTLLSQSLSAYDSILLGCSIFILLMLITIGLIPSVIQTRNAQWLPQSR